MSSASRGGRRLLDVVLNRDVLRILGLLALLGTVGLSVATLLPAVRFTAGWGAGIVGLLTLAAALFSAAAATASAEAGVVAALASQRANSHQLYELARGLHADLTTGPVEEARDRLGRLARDDTPPLAVGAGVTFERRGKDHDRFIALRGDWFVLLWCFERVHAGRQVLRHAVGDERNHDASGGFEGDRRPLDLLDDAIRAQLSFLNRDATTVRERLEQALGPIDDEQSKRGFVALVGGVPGVAAPPDGQRSLGQHLDPAPDSSPATGEPDVLGQEARHNCGRWADPVTTREPELLVEMIEKYPYETHIVLRGLSSTQLRVATVQAHSSRPSSWWGAATNAVDGVRQGVHDPFGESVGHPVLRRHLQTVLADFRPR